ncbi:probable E3 ubiquitin-protein ligase HIP1 [Phragmites australis]|uniref:probable E3 ubiquitin-protein ligase HIP1 n=1 Tax=Phragmites australis TaxID=29695 RepID=UPI002D78954F|nr:probable E3 ubiquitin-protein ligase HIP1 [Phragmites australis]
MQGQRNSLEHFADVFGFDVASSSGNPVMDQQAYWNNVLGSVESQNLQGYEMNHSDATIPNGNETHQDGAFLGFWESGEASSTGSSLNYGSSSSVKTEHLNIGGGLRIGERRLVAENNRSLDVNINLNASISDLCGQSSNVNCAYQCPEQCGGCDRNGTNAQPSDLRSHPYRTFLLGAEQTDSFTSLNPSENPLGDFSFMPEGIDQRPGSSLDGRRLACKRKNIEGANGQSSAGASTSVSYRNDNAFHTNASPSYNAAPIRNSSSPNSLLVPSSVEDQLPRYGTNAGFSSSSYDPSGAVNNTGNSQRSFRARTTTAQQLAPCSVWPSSNTIRVSNSWNHQAPHLHSAFDEPQEVIPVVSSLNLQYQHPINVVPGLPQTANRFTGHAASSSRAGSLENIILGSEEVARRNVVPTNFSDLVPPATVDMRRLVPEPTNWSSDGQGTAISGNIPPVSRANTNSTVNPPAGFTHQNLNRRHSRNLSEEIGRLSGALRGHQYPRLRPGFLLERQGEGVWGVPLSMRGREGRRLMEIRNALEMIHRGENVRLESIFYGGIDIQDRHRDMRLDIDNMSYEELLALEERIGNVNTGLSKDAVTKLLKQRKFSSWRLKASLDHEPCCICQEEYVDGDDLGRLDCGHNFHAACIKQWLVLKNLCPICKNTALKT